MPTTIPVNAEIHPERPDRIRVVASFHVKDLIKEIPGAKWDANEKVWTIPKTWPSCLALRAQFGEGLRIGENLTAWAREESANKNFLRELRGKIDGIDGLTDLGLPNFENLFGHQQVDAVAIAKARRYLLLNETGTGKTWSALAGLSLIAAEGEDIFPLLIIAPKSMVVTWSRETKLFFPDADVRVCQGTPSITRKALEPGGDVYCIGWDAVRRYSRQSAYGPISIAEADKVDKELQQIDFVSSIVDEVHRGQNGQSQRTRAVWQATAKCKNLIGMTGTPMQDTIEDLWAVLRLIFPDQYPTKTAYLDRFANLTWNTWGGREIDGFKESTRDEFFNNFDAIHRRVTKDMALDLPEKIYAVRWVTLPPKLKKAYNAMRDTLVAELEEGIVSAENVLVRASYLLAFANAWGEVDENGKLHLSAPSPKIDAFMEDLDEGDYDDQSVVIFSDSRQIADLLSEQMTKKKIDHVSVTGSVTGDERQEAVDKFQSGMVRFIIVTRAGGEGITLTAARTMVRLVRSWSYTIHKQAEDRVHRIGAEVHDEISYVDYISEDTVEEGQLIRLNGKSKRAQEVLRDTELLNLLKGREADADDNVESEDDAT